MSRWGRYVSKEGRHEFRFRINRRGSIYEILCDKHPPLNGQNPRVEHTHLYKSGRICFVEGREPKSVEEAEKRAGEWAEGYARYIKR